MAEARTLFDAPGSGLEQVEVEGRAAYALAGDTAFPPVAGAVRLLAEYAAYAPCWAASRT